MQVSLHAAAAPATVGGKFPAGPCAFAFCICAGGKPLAPEICSRHRKIRHFEYKQGREGGGKRLSRKPGDLPSIAPQGRKALEAGRNGVISGRPFIVPPGRIKRPGCQNGRLSEKRSLFSISGPEAGNACGRFAPSGPGNNEKKGKIMHIEPGVVSGAKIFLSYGTASAAIGYGARLALKTIKSDGLGRLLARSAIATLSLSCISTWSLCARSGCMCLFTSILPGRRSRTSSGSA